MAALTSEDRVGLLDMLAAFTRSDPDPFVSAHIVLPTDEDFPDRFAPTEACLDRLAQRLLAMAGMADYVATVELARVDPGDAPETRTALSRVEGRVVWLACSRLGRADDAALSFAHEIARAALLVREREVDSPYRSDGRAEEPMVPEDTDDEHARASVLGVCLGLGVLGAIGSYRFQQSGHHVGTMQYTSWRHAAYGGLSPAAASFLLAVQLVVRAIEGTRLSQLLALLPEERRKEVAAEIALLDRGALVDRLGLPPIEQWPSEADGKITIATASPPPKTPKRISKPKRARHPVFRVRRDLRLTGAAGGASLAVIVGLLVHTSLSPGRRPTEVIGEALVGVLFGAWYASRLGWDNCSDCEKTIPPEAERCPGCGRIVVGRIRHASHRLDAREVWRKEERARKRGE